MRRRSLFGMAAKAVAGSALLVPAGAWADSTTASGDASGGRDFDVRKFGAQGDGKTNDKTAIQKAIDACTASGGGIVSFPPGTYFTGDIRLRSNVTLYLHAGATIQGSSNMADYGPSVPERADSYFESRHLIHATDEENIGIAGPGRIDGAGKSFLHLMDKDEIEQVLLQRPEEGRVAQDWYRRIGGPGPMIEFRRCKYVRVEQVRLENAPSFTLYPVLCDSVFINGVVIRNPLYAPNLDGIDTNGCSNVMISNCDVYTCDDAICIKNGEGPSPWRSANITVTNCVVSTTCNGLKVDTVAKDHIIENVAFSNCAVYGDRHPKETGDSPYWPELQDFRPQSGIHLDVMGGGTIAGVSFSNIVMEDVRNPIFISLAGTRPRWGSKENGPGDWMSGLPDTGWIRDIKIDTVYAKRNSLTCQISGIPGRVLENISVSNFRTVSVGGGTLEWAKREFIPEFEADYADSWALGDLPAYGLYCRHVNGLRLRDLEHVTEKPDMRSAVIVDQVENLDVDCIAAQAPPSGMPVIQAKQVKRAFIRGCSAPEGTKTWLEVTGSGTEKITVMGNELAEAANPISTASEVKPGAVFASGNRMPG